MPRIDGKPPKQAKKSAHNRYARHADQYIEAGWTPIAVHGKQSPFKGTTGYNGEVTPEADTEMRRSIWYDNIAIRHNDDTIAIDVDQGNGKRGAEALAALEAALGPLPRTYSSTARGQGDPRRQLFFRKRPDSQLITTITPGLVIGGVTLETGDIELPQKRHRYSVVGPSEHPDTGETYTWYDLDGQPMDGPPRVEDLPYLPWEEALAEEVVRAAGSRSTSGKPSLAQLLADPPTGDGRTESDGRGRNTWLASVAGHCAAQHRGDRDEYVRRVVAANATLLHPLDDVEVANVCDSIWGTDQRNHAGEPPLQTKSEKGEDKPSAYQLMVAFLGATYDLYRTPDGEPFAIPRRGLRRPIYLSEKGEGGLKGQAQYDYEQATGKPLPNTAMVQALTSVYQRTLREAPELRLNLRVARPEPSMVVLDLAQPGNTRCVVVTGEGWEVREEPPQGVAFRTASSTRPLPDPDRAGDPEILRSLLGWSVIDRRWLLTRGWLAASLLPDIARPMLFFHGRAGSSKTTKAVTVVSVTDPRDELGSSFGKNERDEVAMASNRYLVGFDNVSRASEETSDRLSRLVTGTSDERRTLYSDNDQFVVSFRRTGVITGLSVPGFKSDALERIIPIQCESIPSQQRRSEKAIAEERAAKHPAILGAVLTDLATILRNLPASEAREGGKPRMADFSDALHALDPAIAEAFEASANDAMVDAAESDPFVMTIKRWLEHESLPLRLPATEAHSRAERHRDMHDRDLYVWWPKDARAFAGALVRQAGPLEAVGIRATSTRTGRSRAWLFERTDEPSAQAQTQALFDDEEAF